MIKQLTISYLAAVAHGIRIESQLQAEATLEIEIEAAKFRPLNDYSAFSRTTAEGNAVRTRLYRQFHTIHNIPTQHLRTSHPSTPAITIAITRTTTLPPSRNVHHHHHHQTYTPQKEIGP